MRISLVIHILADRKIPVVFLVQHHAVRGSDRFVIVRIKPAILLIDNPINDILVVGQFNSPCVKTMRWPEQLGNVDNNYRTFLWYKTMLIMQRNGLNSGTYWEANWFPLIFDEALWVVHWKLLGQVDLWISGDSGLKPSQNMGHWTSQLWIRLQVEGAPTRNPFPRHPIKVSGRKAVLKGETRKLMFVLENKRCGRTRWLGRTTDQFDEISRETTTNSDYLINEIEDIW